MYSSVLRAIGAAAVVGSSIVLADASPDSESSAVLQSKFFVEDEVNLGTEGDLQEEDQDAAESLEINATNNDDIESGEMWEDTLSNHGEAEEKLEAEPADTSVALTDEELKLLAEGELFEKGQIVEDPDTATVLALLLQARSSQLTHSETDDMDLDGAMEGKGIEIPKLDLHMGPISVGTSGVAVAPQMKFGVSGDGFDITAGCGDIRSGVKCGAQASVTQSCEGSGNSLQSFLSAHSCSGVANNIPGNYDPVSTALTIKAVVLKELGIDIKSHVSVTGKMTVSAGVGVSTGVALGLWDDKDGYKMVGGGAAGVVGLKFAGELYVGVQKRGVKVKFQLGAGPVSIEAVVQTTNRDVRDSRKVNQVKSSPALPGTSPWSSHNADGYKAVGWGYARGRGGAYLPTYAKAGASYTECLIQCNADPNCIGFDSTVRDAGVYQTCCIRMKRNGAVPAGWGKLHRGTENLAVTQGNCPSSAVAAGHNCGLVMAKIPKASTYKTVGYGYCRDTHGRSTLKVIGQWNNWISQALCKKKCDDDSRCTGIDTHRHSGHCILRTGAVGAGSDGWHSNHASPCMKKVTR